MALVDSVDTSGTDARERLLASARDEIVRRGILGLRVADVAANAHYSVSVIYRHFGDRDGLLAAVLGDMYDETLERRKAIIAAQLPAEGPLTLQQVVRLAPAPSEMAASEELRIRLQILAVAATNPALERRIAEIAQRRFVEMQAVIDHVSSRLPDGQRFDTRIFTVMLVNQLLYYNTLLGPYAVDDDSYYDFLLSVASGGEQRTTA